MTLTSKIPPYNRRTPILASKRKSHRLPDGTVTEITVYARFTEKAWRAIPNTSAKGRETIIKNGWKRVAENIKLPKAAKEAIQAQDMPAPKPEPKAKEFDIEAVKNTILMGGGEDIQVEVLRDFIRKEGLQIKGFTKAGAAKLAPQIKEKLENQ